MDPLMFRVLLLGLLAMVALVAALVTGIIVRMDGASWSKTVLQSGCCFAGALTLGILAFAALGLLR
jgi:hypothetical protein